jgi:hypothetical protein
LDHATVLVGPVMAAPAEGSCIAATKAQKRAKAVMLDLVKPACPRRRRYERRDLGRLGRHGGPNNDY